MGCRAVAGNPLRAHESLAAPEHARPSSGSTRISANRRTTSLNLHLRRPDLSIVVPLLDEEECVPHLVGAVQSALADLPEWELILVDDGSSDGTYGRALEQHALDRRVRVLRLARNFGQTAALQAGFDHVRGRVVISMDGDLQNDPRDIPLLLAKLEEGYDLVAGFRVFRRDGLLRTVPSRSANRLLRRLTGVPVSDSGCTLRAYRAELLQRMVLYADMHRFIPALAAAMGGARIAELPVAHEPRRYGRSKYSLGRVPRVMLDLLIVRALRALAGQPLAFFALGALAAAGAGAAAGAAALAMYVSPGGAPPGIVLPGAAILCWALAAYLLMLGLIGEVLVARWRRSHPPALPLVS
jgi:hypothetical protein